MKGKERKGKNNAGGTRYRGFSVRGGKPERSTNPVKDLFMPKSAMFSTCLM